MQAGLKLSSVSYTTPPPRQKAVLSGIDYEYSPGQSVIVRGDNGEGKSTLVRILQGSLRPSSGTMDLEPDMLAVFGEEVDSQLLFSTVREELESCPEYAENSAWPAFLGIDRLVDRSIFELSFSEKARLVLLINFFLGRRIIVADCPPEDQLIDGFIRATKESGARDYMLFLPSGYTRALGPDWRELELKNGRLADL